TFPPTSETEMIEPTISCPNCHTEIKLTESLAAPLIETTRTKYEQEAAKKDADIAKREKALKVAQENVDKAKASIGEQVAAGAAEGREAIAEEGAPKGKPLAPTELQQKEKAVADR